MDIIDIILTIVLYITVFINGYLFGTFIMQKRMIKILEELDKKIRSVVK